MDLNAINLISEYLQTPDSIYKDYLYAKIAKDEKILQLLQAQQSVVAATSSLVAPQMPTSCINLIKPRLKKYVDLTKILHISAISTVSIVGAILGYSVFFKTSVPVAVQPLAPVNPKVQQSIVLAKPQNIFELQKSNVSLLSFAGAINERVNPKTAVGFSGDLKKYKAINAHSNVSDTLLDKAAKEVSSGAANIEQVDSYLQRASIDQHDVKVIENTEIVVRREKR